MRRRRRHRGEGMGKNGKGAPAAFSVCLRARMFLCHVVRVVWCVCVSGDVY